MSPFIAAASGFTIVLLLGLLIGGFLLLQAGRREAEAADPQALIQELPVPAAMTRPEKNELLITWQKNLKAITIEVKSEGFKKLVMDYPPHHRLQITRPVRSRPVATLHIRHSDDETRPLEVAERYLPLKKGVNVRDIGGYLTVDGAQVRWNHVFRGGDLSRLTARDQAFLKRLDLRLICDLRSQHEVEERKDVVPGDVRYRHLPLNDGAGPTRHYFSQFLSHRGQPHALMKGIYVGIVRDRAAALGDWLSLVAEPENLPLMVHCTAGKDRTGVAIALLLALLGVPKEAIFADYVQSNVSFDQLYAAFQLNADQVRRFGIPPSAFRTVLLAHPSWLEAAWAYIFDRYDSVEAYCLAEAGLTARSIAAIRQNMLLPGP